MNNLQNPLFIFVGQTFEVYQSENHCISGILNTGSSYESSINFSDLPKRLGVLSHGEECRKIGRLIITKIK